MIRNVRTFLVEKTFFLSVGDDKPTSTKDHHVSREVITISRQHGCYGAETALALQKLLGKNWIIFHREILEAIANDSGVEKKYLSQFDEKTIPWVEEIVNSFNKNYLNDASYLNYLRKFIHSVAKRGKVILIGRGANFVLKEGFHIRLIAPLEARIKNLMQINKYTRMEALKELEEADVQRKKYIKKLFNADVDDPANYDLVINMKDLSFTQVAKIIFNSAKLSSIFN